MFEPKVELIFNDPKASAKHLCYLAKNISLKRYHNGGFQVLPYLSVKNLYCVHFPDFSYSKMFWNLINKCKNEDYGQGFPSKAINEITDKLKTTSYSNSEEKRIKNLKYDWCKCQRYFFSFIDNYFDKSIGLNKVSKISVLFTDYGTRGSFNILNLPDGTKEITLTHRIDFEVDELTKTILKTIYFLQSNKRAEVGEISFYERQMAVEFHFKNSELSKIFPTTKLNSKCYYTKINSHKDSIRYLNKLGFPPKLPFSIKKRIIYLNNENVDAVFTQQEKDLLTGLISKTGELVSFDEASEHVWKERSYDKFSLFSLAKIVENLRRKLRRLGLNSEMIKTVRNRGYILNG